VEIFGPLMVAKVKP